MSTAMVFRSLVVGGFAFATFAWLVPRAPDEPPVPAARVNHEGTREQRGAVVEAPSRSQSTASASARALGELHAMSETFRNTTLLIAIRDGGFVCETVIDAIQTGVEEDAWLARCRDLHAYQVGVTEGGSLLAVPVVEHFDQVAPRISERSGVNGPFEQLERR